MKRCIQPSDLSPALALLRRLGATPNYAGYIHTAHAISLAAQDEALLRCMMSHLYPTVAACCGTSPAAVERNIRTLVLHIWCSNRPLLEQLAGRPLAQKPSNGVFLSIAAACLPHQAD